MLSELGSEIMVLAIPQINTINSGQMFPVQFNSRIGIVSSGWYVRTTNGGVFLLVKHNDGIYLVESLER